MIQFLASLLVFSLGLGIPYLFQPKENLIYVGGPAIPLQVYQGGTSTSTRPIMGQILIGNSIGNYSLNTLIAGSNITITNATNSITIASTGGGGGGLDFVFASNFGTTTAATNTPIWFTSYLFASSSIIAGGPINASSSLTVANLATLDTGFISSASSTVAGSFQISGNFQASSSLSLATTTITVNVASVTPGIPLTLRNTQSATNTETRLAFQVQEHALTNLATTTSAISSILTQNYDQGTGFLSFSTLNAGRLTEAGRFTDLGGLIVKASSTFAGATTTVTGVLATQKSFGLALPPDLVATNTTLTLRHFNIPVTINEVTMVADYSGSGAVGNVTAQFYHDIDRSASTTGTTLFSVAQNTVSSTTGVSITAFNDNTINRGEWLTFSATQASSSPNTGITITVYYTPTQ